jgi:hypothetical protein
VHSPVGNLAQIAFLFVAANRHEVDAWLCVIEAKETHE